MADALALPPADRSSTGGAQISPAASQDEPGWPDTDHPTLAALRSGTPQEKETALRTLFTAYSQPVRSYIRHHWPLLQDADVDDLTAEFIALCLTGGKAHFLTYDPDRTGFPVRLRTYLATVLDNFLRNHHRNAHAQVRGGNHHFESLDTIHPAAHQEAQAAGSGPPFVANGEVYDFHWALHIINASFCALEKDTPSTREWLPILRPWILADPGAASLKEIAHAKGTTHAAVRAQLYRLRKLWRQAVRHAVAQTVFDPTEVDDELRHLAAVLSRHPVE
jgi:hypothetical protein